ncbi:MAG: hypothetical protein AAGL17_17450 [Cyanobacteria bacterium J06576_12]
MTATSSSSPSDASIENPAASGGDKSELDQIIHQLRRKEGTWVSIEANT